MREPEYMPTPEEIAKACEAVRAGWSDDERELRSTTRYFPVSNRELQKARTLRGGE